MLIKVKRVYDREIESEEFRVLVDRLWPRGLSKRDAKIDLWAKDVAPTNQLRIWYHHDPGKWPLFKERYFEELDEKIAEIEKLAESIKGREVIFLYSSRSPLNNAVALKEYLESRYFALPL